MSNLWTNTTNAIYAAQSCFEIRVFWFSMVPSETNVIFFFGCNKLNRLKSWVVQSWLPKRSELWNSTFYLAWLFVEHISNESQQNPLQLNSSRLIFYMMVGLIFYIIIVWKQNLSNRTQKINDLRAWLLDTKPIG